MRQQPGTRIGLAPSFIAKRFDRIEAGGFAGRLFASRVEAEEDADSGQKQEAAANSDRGTR